MLAARSWAAPPGDAALGFSPTGKHTSPRREHPQPANSASLPLRDGGDDGARYVRFRGEPDIAGDVATSGKNTSPRREHPQVSDAARNPRVYGFRRQGDARRGAGSRSTQSLLHVREELLEQLEQLERRPF